MSLTDQYLADNKKILSDNNAFAIEVTYKDPVNGDIQIPAFYNSVTREVETNTGLPVISQNPSIVINWSVLDDFLNDGIISELPKKASKFDIVYAGKTYQTITRSVNEDRRLNMITYLLVAKNG